MDPLYPRNRYFGGEDHNKDLAKKLFGEAADKMHTPLSTEQAENYIEQGIVGKTIKQFGVEGVWKDPDTGEMTVDLVIRFTDGSAAINRISGRDLVAATVLNF